MFRRLVFLCFLIAGGLLASAQEVNYLVYEGKIFDAVEKILFDSNIAIDEIEYGILRDLGQLSMYWSPEQRNAFLRRIGLSASLNTVSVAISQERRRDGIQENRFMGLFQKR
jgi:hypothetical protein